MALVDQPGEDILLVDIFAGVAFLHGEPKLHVQDGLRDGVLQQIPPLGERADDGFLDELFELLFRDVSWFHLL